MKIFIKKVENSYMEKEKKKMYELKYLLKKSKMYRKENRWTMLL